jgi:hypothetical protein
MNYLRFWAFILAAGASSMALGCGGDDDDDDDSTPEETPVELVDWPEARDLSPQALAFPEWARSMRLWPFDILTPTMTTAEIDERVQAAADEDANAIIFYIESEHMYGTFVDDTGFSQVQDLAGYLTEQANALDMPTIVYVNGLEVMTRGAYDDQGNSTGIATMATTYPDWLQLDLDGEPIVYGNQSSDWLEPDWEDAWLSPYSGYRDFFKTRIEQLADAAVDGIYIDATFLPGFQPDDEALRWGSTDPAFASAFADATGLDCPTEADFDSAEFRAFLTFRHEALADYLGDLAQTALDSGMTPFWESSTNDTPEATVLGNSTAVTGREGLGLSPEIEPEGDFFAAFRMAKAARELNQGRPMIYLGWPESAEDAECEFAVALAHSNTYYPTADIEVPEGAFDFMDRIAEVLGDRAPYGGNVALVYSDRNQDYTWEDETAFEAYVDAFEQLTQLHIPLRIAPLEYLATDGLDGVDTVILPGTQAISDAEAAELEGRTVVPVGEEVGTRDADWTERSAPLEFSETADLDAVTAELPFSLEAPEGTFIEYYRSRTAEGRMYLFAVSPDPGGAITIDAAEGESVAVSAYSFPDGDADDAGTSVTVDVDSRLIVLAVSPE